jgi:hypothetical protein
MKCLGRTRALKRCRNQTRRYFCHHHWYQPWAVLVTVFTLIATAGGFYRDLIEPALQSLGQRDRSAKKQVAPQSHESLTFSVPRRFVELGLSVPPDLMAVSGTTDVHGLFEIYLSLNDVSDGSITGVVVVRRRLKASEFKDLSPVAAATVQDGNILELEILVNGKVKKTEDSLSLTANGANLGDPELFKLSYSGSLVKAPPPQTHLIIPLLEEEAHATLDADDLDVYSGELAVAMFPDADADQQVTGIGEYEYKNVSLFSLLSKLARARQPAD